MNRYYWRLKMRINHGILHEMYKEIAWEGCLWITAFRRRINAWYSIEQILRTWRFGKIPGGKMRLISTLEEPRRVKKNLKLQEREKYWKDYFLNELKNERI